MKLPYPILCVCVTFTATVQAQLFGTGGGSSGSLGLDIIKSLGRKDDPGYEFIDAGAFVSARRSSDASRTLPDAPGQQGPPVAPPVAPPVPVDVDLCYLVDITGSMAPHIKAVKDSIRETVTYLTTSTGAVGVLRLCFVGYRDFKDDRPIETLPLTSDVASFLAFVDRLDATGGADLPEDVFSGLEEMGRQDWRAPRRVVMHMADAPCHGDGCGGGTPDPKGRNANDVFRPLRAEKIQYNFGRINLGTEEMMKLFREAYGHKFQLFDVSPDPEQPKAEVPRSEFLGGPGGPGGTAWAPWSGVAATAPPPKKIPTDRGLKRKVGQASIAAVLLGISK